MSLILHTFKEKMLDLIKEYANRKEVKGIFYIPEIDKYYATILIDNSRNFTEPGDIGNILQKVIEAHNGKCCNCYYPFKISGERKFCHTFEEVLMYAIYDYQTFEPEGVDYYYSLNELKVMSEIVKYQKSMAAVLEPLKFKNVSKGEIEQYSHTKIRHILNKKIEKNNGIFYIPSLDAYTSTHLYENYEKQKGIRIGGGCNYKRLRRYGELYEILPETLMHYDGSKITLRYPYRVAETISNCYKVEEIFRIAVSNPYQFSLVNDRNFYSRQTKRNIKYIIKYQQAALEGKAP